MLDSWTVWEDVVHCLSWVHWYVQVMAGAGQSAVGGDSPRGERGNRFTNGHFTTCMYMLKTPYCTCICHTAPEALPLIPLMLVMPIVHQLHRECCTCNIAQYSTLILSVSINGSLGLSRRVCSDFQLGQEHLNR